MVVRPRRPPQVRAKRMMQDVMKHIAQADSLERIPIHQQEFHTMVGATCQTEAGFSDRADLHHSDGRPGDTGQSEIVMWILIMVLVALTITAFFLLWIKAGGK